MDRYDLMLQLPALYAGIPFAQLQEALGQAVRQAGEDVDFALQQLWPQTASSWGLELWETAYGIQASRDGGNALRRARILAKIRGQGVPTAELIRSVAAAFVDGTVAVEERHEDYFFLVALTLFSGAYPDYALICDAVDLVKPAHLAYQITLRFTPAVSVYTGLATRMGDVWIVGPVECSGHTESQICAGMLPRRSDVIRMAAVPCPQPSNPVTVSAMIRRSDIMISILEE